MEFEGAVEAPRDVQQDKAMGLEFWKKDWDKDMGLRVFHMEWEAVNEISQRKDIGKGEKTGRIMQAEGQPVKDTERNAC